MSQQNNTKFKLVPVKTSKNAALLKRDILIDNRNLSGIYRWVNNISGKVYVGSAINLSKRLIRYYHKSELLRNKQSIFKALAKYGHEIFTLEILEYVKWQNNDELLKREQFYFDLLQPEYNILRHAYSMLGFKHSQETIKLLKSRIKTPEYIKNLSLAWKKREAAVSEITRQKLSLATARYKKKESTVSWSFSQYKS